ncbi:MAG: hypothetical protein M1837_003809 [Sclerophora amabilis]|nr:MAG: hypothetical protein M1837_003809 [Sclerophora amabilis]
MDLENEMGDAFSIADVWKPTKLALLGEKDSSPFFPALISDEGPGHLGDPFSLKSLEDGREALETFCFNSPFHHSLPDESAVSSDVFEDYSRNDDDVEGLWKLAGTIQDYKTLEDYSWDAFLKRGFKESFPTFLSEAGSHTFDAALGSKSPEIDPATKPGLVLKQDFFVQCLAGLGLGRGSAIFQYNEERGISDIRYLYGEYVADLVSSYNRFLQCGNITRFLQNFVERTYSDNVHVSLLALQIHIGERQGSMQSILQLQSLFKTPHQILECFQDLITTLSSEKDEVHLLSSLYDKLSQLEHQSEILSKILFELVKRASRPWLESVENRIGLRHNSRLFAAGQGSEQSFFYRASKASLGEQQANIVGSRNVLFSESVPTFVTEEDAQSVFESGKALLFLEANHPEHPLVNENVSLISEAPTLEWKLDWEAVEKIEAKSKAYERSLVAAIKEYSAHGNRDANSPPADISTDLVESDCFGINDAAIQTRFTQFNALLSQPLGKFISTARDNLQQIILEELRSETSSSSFGRSNFAPPISLVPVLSFHPIIATQARLINSSCLRLYFREHGLRLHISFQRRFQLLGDGIFTTRLSHALFDPEMNTAQCTTGVSRSGAFMGLKLGSRENWPPASSELRLALMGILMDSYDAQGARSKLNGGSGFIEEMPGGLSFAVRDLSPDELERCMDPDSVAALDFLKIHYKPPSPLEAVITPSCLHKYDLLFRLFIRVLRLLHAVNQLFRDATDRTSRWGELDHLAQKFRIEAHHFVSTLYGYFIEVGVGVPWARFERKLDEMEACINREGANGLVGHFESLDRLQQYHESVLDTIMFATFLRRRQEQVMDLLENVFIVILAFAKYSRSRAMGTEKSSGDEDDVRALYTKFRKGVNVFVTVCRGLAEKRGSGERKMEISGPSRLFGNEDLSEDGGNTIGMLLLRLSMNGYYSKPF